MSGIATYGPKDDPENRTPGAIQARLRTTSLDVAELAATGQVVLVEQLVNDAQTTEDPELRRRIFESLQKAVKDALPQQQVQVWAPLSFTIVTDPSIPQVAPVRASKKIAEDVEYVEIDTPTEIVAEIVSPPPETATPAPVPDPLEDLLGSLNNLIVNPQP